VGGAEVSPTHGNFIVNDGNASARDIRALVERCRQAVEARFHVRLRDEIVYLGEFLNEQESAGVHTAD
jgi:UDP-N-acetylmuramate dehydrogenase